MPKEATEKLTIKKRKRNTSKLPKKPPPDIVFKPIKTELDALKVFKKMFRECAPFLFGEVKNPKRINEAMAIGMSCAGSYIELSARGLSYIATKSKAPDEDVILLDQLRTQIGDVNTIQGDRERYFRAAQNVVHMWEALPNDNYHHRSTCVDIELLRQEVTMVNGMLHKVIKAQGKDKKTLPIGYGTIGDQRNRMIANIKSLYETVGLTAKAMKDIKSGSDTGHALNRLQISTTSKATRLSSDGIGNLLDKIGERPKEFVVKKAVVEEEADVLPEAQQGDVLSPIDEAYISQPFGEQGDR